jgi:hypothetical protein
MSARASSGLRNSERLGARRRAARRRAFILLTLLIIALIAAAMYGLRQNAVRISRVEIFGADPSLAADAMSAMQGSYFGIIPRDSIFFFPAERIRENILSANGDIAAVSIFRSSFSSISINVDLRTPIARWCGSTSLPDATSTSSCYVFDDSGLVYARAASTTQPINPFALYAPLASTTTGPIGVTIVGADQLPATFDFARQLATLGAPVTSIVIHDGQVDDYVASSTRITYLLGDEQNAYTELVSADSNFNLTDGSVDYVDLRFDGKVYLKKN